MIETTITLKPPEQWPPGTTKASIVSDLSARLMNLPGYVPGFLQPIENRVLMTSTGIRAQVGVKVFGDDLAALQQQAFAIERVINQVPGAVGVAPSRVQGKPYVEVQVRREQLGRYGLSVAVWVGYIALFGTAIQTGIIMVTYLDESVQAARARLGRALTRAELTDAVKAGARLRLRPKVMTVATTVASLTPIFWLERTGVEIMQPLAAPVVGGMLSSLVHILIVTPVIFAWLREGEEGQAD